MNCYPITEFTVDDSCFSRNIPKQVMTEIKSNNIVPCFCATVGSDVYNLRTPSSDFDYNIYAIPSFQQIYEHSYPMISLTTELYGDWSVTAIPRLEDRLCKGNPEAFNILFSRCYLFPSISDCHREYGDSCDFPQTRADIYSIFLEMLMNLVTRREDIVRASIGRLYDSAIGMFHSEVNQLTRSGGKDGHFVGEIGYNPKSACHAYRILDLLDRYKSNLQNGVSAPYAKALRYEEGKQRDFIIDIKLGRAYSGLKEASDSLNSKFTSTIDDCAQFYDSERKIDRKDDADIPRAIIRYAVQSSVMLGGLIRIPEEYKKGVMNDVRSTLS